MLLGIAIVAVAESLARGQPGATASIVTALVLAGSVVLSSILVAGKDPSLVAANLAILGGGVAVPILTAHRGRGRHG